MNDGKLDKAKAAKEELKELQNRFDLLYDLDEDEQNNIEDKVNNGTAKQVGGDVKPDKKNIVKSFVNIVKAGFLHKRQTRQTLQCITLQSHPTHLTKERERSESALQFRRTSEQTSLNCVVHPTTLSSMSMSRE